MSLLLSLFYTLLIQEAILKEQYSYRLFKFTLHSSNMILCIVTIDITLHIRTEIGLKCKISDLLIKINILSNLIFCPANWYYVQQTDILSSKLIIMSSKLIFLSSNLIIMSSKLIILSSKLIIPSSKLIFCPAHWYSVQHTDILSNTLIILSSKLTFCPVNCFCPRRIYRR